MHFGYTNDNKNVLLDWFSQVLKALAQIPRSKQSNKLQIFKREKGSLFCFQTIPVSSCNFCNS